MLETTFRGTSKPSALILLEPRQVMLARQQNMKNKKNSSETIENDTLDKTQTQKPSLKEKKKKKSNKESSPLLLSIANLLELKGFYKTLAAFKSEASIEELDGLKGHSLDLEVMYYKFLETSKYDGKPNNNSSEKLDLQIEEVAEKDKGEIKCDAIKSVSKVKKKEHKGNDTDDSVDKLTNEAAVDLPVKSKDKKKKSKLISDSSCANTQKVDSQVFQEPSDKMVCETQVDEPDRKLKEKKKKKSKPTSESLAESVEQGGLIENGTLDKSVAENISSEGPLEEKNVKSKDKRRKKNKLTTESLSEEKEDSERGDSKKTDPKKDLPTLEGNGIKTEKSKKRKRLGSEENKAQPDDKIESKESKQSKTKGSEEDKGKDDFLKADALLESDGHTGKKRKMENGQPESNMSLKSSLNEQPSAIEKSAKKQHNGSAEPKTVNAFRRVDIEKVEFVDDRLQDNSYWAKDGADSGYGAKAQEVLGQVRGRDFRHEKTKKKRGSYRGGQIDLQSHSVKFSYSDEE